MATTRVQLNSKTYQVDVYKAMPSLDISKRYSIKVERLTVPAQSGGLIPVSYTHLRAHET